MKRKNKIVNITSCDDKLYGLDSMGVLYWLDGKEWHVITLGGEILRLDNEKESANFSPAYPNGHYKKNGIIPNYNWR